MKKKLFLSALVAGTLSLTSCKKYFEDVNVSPNDPAQVTVGLQLSGAQGGFLLAHTGHLARLSGLWVQHTCGYDRQYLAYDRYLVTESDIDNEWASMYGDNMANTVKMIQKADSESSPYYAGIGRVMLAMSLGVTTDLWGDIPYSQAFKGVENPQPSYDSQQTIYNNIQSILDQAISNLKTDVTQNRFIPADDGKDLLLNGDVQQWLGVAWALKARYANHLSKKDPSGSANVALAYLDSAYAYGFSTSTELNAIFGEAGTNNNLWYQYNSQRGDMVMGKSLVDTMTKLNDPRLALYADVDANGGISGGAPGAGNINGDASYVGTYYAGPSSSVPLVTYAEAKFIEAEAALRAGNTTRAANAFNEAVLASISRMGLSSGATYLAGLTSYTDGMAISASNISLKDIMIQKYISGFTQIETYNDVRRTGFPQLSMPDQAFTSGFPKRFPTAMSERTFNGNASVNQNLMSPVWWDQ